MPLAGNITAFCSGNFRTINRKDSDARGINDAGQIVGGFEDGDGVHGYLLNRRNFTTIDVPNSTFTRAEGINDAGQIVGISSEGVGATRGFLLSEGNFTTIAFPGPTDARGINDAGQIVGSFFDASGRHGFLLSEGNFTTIDVPGSFFTTEPHEINNAGQIVGTFFDFRGAQHGFLATPVPDTPVPEPGTLIMLSAGVLGLLWRGRHSDWWARRE